jgi:putative endonuclease
MVTTRERGAEAEDIAINYLLNQGYEILDKNWYNHHHELDIIARKDGILAVIEVKSLSSNAIREPYESVNRNKQRMIISATNAYIRRHNINDDVRFDIISILFRNNEPQIEHIENAFYPGVR